MRIVIQEMFRRCFLIYVITREQVKEFPGHKLSAFSSQRSAKTKTYQTRPKKIELLE